MIRVEGVGKVFSDGNESKTVLKDITFHIKKGELVTLLGESGCGKSTLLEMIGGFMKSTSGEIYIGGMRVTRPIRTCVTLFQDGNLLPWLAVLDNDMPGLFGTNTEKREKAVAVLKLDGFEGHLKHLPHELSDGRKHLNGIPRPV